MVVVTAYVSLKPESIVSALNACSVVRVASIAEPGCERYDFFQSPDDATKVVFVEEWTSKGHLDTHFEQAAFQTFFAEMSGYTSNPPELRIFESALLG
jgi:quinol monooxygenase YgiN